MKLISSSRSGGIRPWHVLMLAGIVRAILICWAEYQDKHMSVKYTDIDYVVFTDAARFVARGGSPYQRDTYRYSPLLAYLLLPNIWLHPSWGKVLFSASDLLAAGLMSYLLRRTAPGAPPTLWTAALAAWLFNPYTATISTRGSCDVLSVLLLLALLTCLLHGRSLVSGLLYGLAVHFRIYPVIYGPAIALYLARRSVAQLFGIHLVAGLHGPHGVTQPHQTAQPTQPTPRQLSGSHPHVSGKRRTGWRLVMVARRDNPGVERRPGCSDAPETGRAHMDSRRGGSGGIGLRLRQTKAALPPLILFAVGSAASFLLLAGLFYSMYGNMFLNEAFLHHLTRKDPRHNFSPYYYPVYLSYGRGCSSRTSTSGASSTGTSGEAAGDGAAARSAAAKVATAAVPEAVRLLRERRSCRELIAAGRAALPEAWKQGWEAWQRGGSRGSGGGRTSARAYSWAGGRGGSARWGTALAGLVPWQEPWRLAALLQAAALLALAVRFHDDLPAAWLLQTWAFVALNKVVTAQYFVWYLSLLPLVLPSLAAQRRVTRGSLLAGAVCWVVAQLHWLAWAYQLEMKGRSVHAAVWAAGLIFLAANTLLIAQLAIALKRRRRHHHHEQRQEQNQSESEPTAGAAGGGISSDDNHRDNGSEGDLSEDPSFLEVSLMLVRGSAREASSAAKAKQQ